IALDILGLSGAREFERCGSAEAIAHHHGSGVSAVARLVQAREQELPHPRAVLVELRRLSLSGVGIRGAVAFAIEIECEGVVAERGDHVGALLLVLGHAAPRMNDDYDSLGGTGGLGAIALEGLSVRGVGDIFASVGRQWKQRGGKRKYNR